MRVNNRIMAVFLSLFPVLVIMTVLSACPSTYPDLPTMEDMIGGILKEKLNGTVVAVMEAEDGKLVGFGRAGQEQPAIYTSGTASGGRFVKNIGVEQGYVEVTVPATAIDGSSINGTYNLAIAWSSGQGGGVRVDYNPDDDDGDFTEKNYAQPTGPAVGSGWEMEEPQYMVIFEDTAFKAGDVIRVRNGTGGGWIHLDAVYLYTPD